MTAELELARLRLEAWRLLEGWGRTIPLADDDPLRKFGRPTRQEPHGFEERCALADRLVAWAMREG